MRLHRNARRLIQPLAMVNPYADRLSFLDDKTRMRRDHMKYLSLIRAITLLHQYQREVKTVQHKRKAGALHRGGAGRHCERRRKTLAR